MEPEEGGLIGFIDTPTMHELLDVTALRAETRLNVRMTCGEEQKTSQEEKRLAEMELLECPMRSCTRMRSRRLL